MENIPSSNSGANIILTDFKQAGRFEGILYTNPQASQDFNSHIFQDYILMRSGKSDFEIEEIKLNNEKRIFTLLNSR